MGQIISAQSCINVFGLSRVGSGFVVAISKFVGLVGSSWVNKFGPVYISAL